MKQCAAKMANNASVRKNKSSTNQKCAPSAIVTHGGVAGELDAISDDD